MYLKMTELETGLSGNFCYSKKDLIKVWIRTATIAVVNIKVNQMKSYLRDKKPDKRWVGGKWN